MLVGDGLGVDEESFGRPFVGDAGRKLNYCLNRAGLRRKTLRLSNAVRCRTSRAPSRAQMQSCYPYLLYDILKTRPKVIVALGASAFKVLEATINIDGELKPELGKKLKYWRGFYRKRTFTWTSSKGRTLEHTCYVLPAFHPSACLHSWELDERLIFDLRLAKELGEGKEPLAYPTTKVTVAKTFQDAKALIKQLMRRRSFVLDLETTGISPHDSRILCIGVCWKAGESHVLPMLGRYGKPVWSRLEMRELVRLLTILLEQARLAGQNLKFDTQHLRALLGIVDYEIVFDTMCAHHTLNENAPHNLTYLAQWYLRWHKYDAAMASYIGRFAEAPEMQLWRYCGYDCDATYQLWQKFDAELDAERVRKVYQIEENLIAPLADMEYRGIQGDRTLLGQLTNVYRRTAAGLEKRLQITATKTMGVIKDAKGKPIIFNPRSTAQLTRLLVEAGAVLKRKTASGKNLSVNKFVMAALALKQNKAGRICRDIQEIRRLTKYISTYLDGKDGAAGFKVFLRSKDRWHPNYNITASRTSRLSADDPAIQTLPRGGNLRAMILPDQSDHRILQADYVKIELCVMSWLANDSTMIRELKQGIDLHTRMAVTARLMRDPTDEEFAKLGPLVTKDERAVLGKGINFGIPYGRGASAIADANPDAFPPEMEPYERKAQVQRAIDAYFVKYTGIAAYRQNQVDKMERNGRLRSYLYGRLRRLTGIEWFDSKWGMEIDKRDLDRGHMEREAMNFEVQGIASMILNDKTRIVYDAINQQHKVGGANRIPGFRMIMTLHDALIFNCHKDYTDQAGVLIKKHMELVLPKSKRHKSDMPLNIDIQVMRNWGAEYTEEETT